MSCCGSKKLITLTPNPSKPLDGMLVKFNYPRTLPSRVWGQAVFAPSNIFVFVFNEDVKHWISKNITGFLVHEDSRQDFKELTGLEYTNVV